MSAMGAMSSRATTRVAVAATTASAANAAAMTVENAAATTVANAATATVGTGATAVDAAAKNADMMMMVQKNALETKLPIQSTDIRQESSNMETLPGSVLYSENGDEELSRARETSAKMNKLLGSIRAVEFPHSRSLNENAVESTRNDGVNMTPTPAEATSSGGSMGAINMLETRTHLNSRYAQGRLTAADLKMIFAQKKRFQQQLYEEENNLHEHDNLEMEFIDKLASQYQVDRSILSNILKHTSPIKVLEVPEGGEVRFIGVWDNDRTHRNTDNKLESMADLMAAHGIKRDYMDDTVDEDYNHYGSTRKERHYHAIAHPQAPESKS